MFWFPSSSLDTYLITPQHKPYRLATLNGTVTYQHPGASVIHVFMKTLFCCFENSLPHLSRQRLIHLEDSLVWFMFIQGADLVISPLTHSQASYFFLCGISLTEHDY